MLPRHGRKLGLLSALVVAVAIALPSVRGPKRPITDAQDASIGVESKGPFGGNRRRAGLKLPTGDVAELSCRAAREIVRAARGGLAYEPAPVDEEAFASATLDWLDPHGLWGTSAHSPIEQAVTRRAHELRIELEARDGACVASEEVGRTLARWVETLRAVYDRGRHAAEPEGAGERLSAPVVSEARPIEESAFELGVSMASIAKAAPAQFSERVARADSRYFPKRDAGFWARVVLAAAVRAYVPRVDPHGAWAPLDEEVTLFDVELENAPERVWAQISRVPLGVIVEEGAREPLRDGDVVVDVEGLPIGGMPLEQIEQRVLSAVDTSTHVRLTVVRAGSSEPFALDVPSGALDEDDDEMIATLDHVDYGAGRVAVIGLTDVGDDLGPWLARVIASERQTPGLAGIVLDLRGNPGGSADGAVDAISLFLPGAPVFPMRHRSGSVDVERASVPPPSVAYDGPVAAIVDSGTASAAEMIAGALLAYERGHVIGERTFGKGCVQEFVDGPSGGGAFRLTTMLFALPDGKALQRVGLLPDIALDVRAEAHALPIERESALAAAAPSWTGPDVRDRAIVARHRGMRAIGWPDHGGRVGACEDARLCAALRSLGSRSRQRRPAARR